MPEFTKRKLSGSFVRAGLYLAGLRRSTRKNPSEPVAKKPLDLSRLENRNPPSETLGSAGIGVFASAFDLIGFNLGDNHGSAPKTPEFASSASEQASAFGGNPLTVFGSSEATVDPTQNRSGGESNQADNGWSGVGAVGMPLPMGDLSIENASLFLNSASGSGSAQDAGVGDGSSATPQGVGGSASPEQTPGLEPVTSGASSVVSDPPTGVAQDLSENPPSPSLPAAGTPAAPKRSFMAPMDGAVDDPEFTQGIIRTGFKTRVDG